MSGILSSIKSFAKDTFDIVKYVVTNPSQWVVAIAVLYMMYQVLAVIFNLPHRLGLFNTLMLAMVTSIYQNTTNK